MPIERIELAAPVKHDEAEQAYGMLAATYALAIDRGDRYAALSARDWWDSTVLVGDEEIPL